MGFYSLDISGIFIRPPLKPAGGKPFMADPESLPVIGQNFDGGPAFIAEDEHITAKRVCFQLDPAQTGQPVNAAPEINGLHRNKYSHMRGNLDHDCLFQNARLSS